MLEVDGKAETAKRAIEGDKQAVTPRKEKGLEKRVGSLEWYREQFELQRCADQRFNAAVWKRLTPPVIVTVVGCENVPEVDVEIKAGWSMPTGGKPQLVVITAMPSPSPEPEK
jgi:hypothetical protein